MSWFAAPACGAVARPFSWTARYAPGHRALRVGQLTTSSPRTKQKQYTVTCSSSSDRFAFVQPGAPDGRNRGDLAVGMEVDIVLKQDQGSGRLTRGVVREFLTNSRFHPQGIKVRLVDGGIGRVEVVVGAVTKTQKRRRTRQAKRTGHKSKALMAPNPALPHAKSGDRVTPSRRVRRNNRTGRRLRSTPARKTPKPNRPNPNPRPVRHPPCT